MGRGEGVWGVRVRVGRGNRGGWGRERIGHFHCSHWILLHLRHTLDKEEERRKLSHTHIYIHIHKVMPTSYHSLCPDKLLYHKTNVFRVKLTYFLKLKYVYPATIPV